MVFPNPLDSLRNDCHLLVIGLRTYTNYHVFPVLLSLISLSFYLSFYLSLSRLNQVFFFENPMQCSCLIVLTHILPVQRHTNYSLKCSLSNLLPKRALILTFVYMCMINVLVSVWIFPLLCILMILD